MVAHHTSNKLIEFVIDKSKNSKDIIEFNNYLANHLASLIALDARLIIDHIPSNTLVGLQAVDLFCWGIFKKYESVNEDWYNIYENRIWVEDFI